ncbi:MAG: MFS transporter [Oscillospiraceae bacterium]
MLKNKKFATYAIAFNILGIIFMFMYSGLQNDHYNIITSFSAWSASQIQIARTVAEFVCIALTFVYGTFFMKYGVRKTLIPCIMLCALGCIGITAANGLLVTGGVGTFWLFNISSFVLRCCCMCFQMAGFQLAANWFIKYRGRVLGIVTLGSPLFSVVGVGGMTNLIANTWNGDYRFFYVGISVVLVVIAILTRFLLRDTPEEVGLYPDGADHAPLSEGQSDEIHLTVKQVLSEKRAWLLIVSYGAFQFIINCCMSSMATRYMSLDPAFLSGASPAPTVWLAATKWLSVGAILGIFMSYVFGWIDDKFGTIKASIALGIAEIIPVSMLMFMPEGGNIPMEILWGFGVACMTGGVPTMHPASITYAYGRREYQSANRIIMAIQLIPSAMAAYMMAALIESGHGVLAYGICLVVIAIGLVATWMLRKVPDAMAADRDFAKKAE